MANSDAIKKTDTLGEVMEKYPEVAPLLAQAGLHCIGCHVSAYESIQDGCKSHGLEDKQITEIITAANKLIAQFDKLPKVKFGEAAVEELVKRKSAKKTKFVKIIPVFGEFDFEATNDKEKTDSVVVATAGKKEVSVVMDAKTERMLRGIAIDYDKKQKDFVAKSERKLDL